TRAFNRIMDAFSLPKGTDAEKSLRSEAIQAATRYAIEVPFRTMQKAFESFEIIRAMVEFGNPNSVTDAGVGALCVRSAVIGAYLNVKVNGAGFKDKAFLDDILEQADDLLLKTKTAEDSILAAVLEKIS
ncbi:MAG: cyclodeaminase/cyclohydrolase family protein, partial [Bacteroidales bacterium]